MGSYPDSHDTMIGNKYKLDTNSPVNRGMPNIMPFPVESQKEETEKNSYENWFIGNVFYIIGFYDVPNNNVSFPWDTRNGNTNVSEYNTGTNTDNFPDWWYQPSSQMHLNYMYYMQMQPNLDANHLTKNIETTNSHAVWARGGRISTIIRKSCGFFEQIAKDMRLSADPLSPDAKDERDKHIIREKILMILKPAWEKHVKDMASMPQQAKPFEAPEEIDKWASTELKDFLADDYLNIAVDNYSRQYWSTEIRQIYLDARICDCTGIEHRVNEGIYTKEVIMPYNLIVDTRYSDPFGRKRRFAGLIEQLTLTEIYTRYTQLNDDDRKALYEIAISQQAGNSLNNVLPNLPWFNYNTNYVNGNYNDMTISNVRVYWIAPEEIDGRMVQTVYTAELLAGMFLLNFGKCENIIENPYNPYVPMLPLQILTPDMNLGIFNSAVTRDRVFQDDYDRIRFKQMEMLSKARGVVAFVNGVPFGDNTDVLDMENDFAKVGFTLIVPSGQANNPSDRQRMVELWDRRLDPAYQQLSQKLQEISAEMEMNMGETAITLGENTRYIGKDAYKESSEAGVSGTYSFDEKVMTFIQMNMDYGINIKKNLYANGYLEEEAESVVGKDGLWRLKKTKDRYTRDFGIYLELNDKMDAQQKKEMFELLQPKFQSPNSGYTESDIINLYMTTTKTALKDKVKIIEARIKKEREKAQQAAMQNQQQQLQAKLQHEKETMAFDAHAKQQKTETLIKPKQEKLDTERILDGLPPLHPELQQPQNIPQQPQNIPQQPQNIPQQPNQQ